MKNQITERGFPVPLVSTEDMERGQIGRTDTGDYIIKTDESSYVYLDSGYQFDENADKKVTIVTSPTTITPEV